jgi:hypothetical protein
MAIADGPRVPAGYVSETSLYGNLVTDLTESIPALTWPSSINTYAAMRNDTQIGAILRAYTLPLRAASWLIDPDGCKPAVVKMCADALGLPVLGGSDTTAGPFRRRGVLWDEHLDVALDMLIYGHMPFAIGGEVTGSPLQWRLTTLSERMPSTLTNINVNSDGTLKEIIQFGSENPIPASNLLWYTHGRRGGNWAGRSMLRESYAPWLLKHEMWRVLATSGRRFGTGIPVVNAPTGATDAQIGYAAQLASAMRVGDQAGMGLPSGYTAQIAAMTGTLPDILGFVRYLDQQIATSVLATVLNLDNSPNGSRALGDTLLSILMQSWKAVAREVAIPANRLLADMVDWNYGEDENVPRIVVRDLMQPEPTAEAVSLMLQYGAIKYDPNLEHAMRDKYQLPEPDQEWLDEQQAATNAANAALQLANQAATDKVNGAPDNSGNAPGNAGTPPPDGAPADQTSKAPAASSAR